MSTSTEPVPPTNGEPPAHQPYVPDDVTMPEFTWGPILLGALLGIVFGASSLYLLMKVSMTVSASVPIAGEKGGASAKMVFIGFGIALVHKFLMKACKLWSDGPAQNLYVEVGGQKAGLKGAAVSGDLSPEMLGVGYLIGPRIACWMMA